MSSLATSLWTRVSADIAGAIGRMLGYRRVVGTTDDGKLRVIDHDPTHAGEREVYRLRGVPVDPGDDVLTVTLPGGLEFAIGSVLKPGEDALQDYVSELGGDGSSTAAAREDHQHRSPAGTSTVQIGGGASVTASSSIAIGAGAQATDSLSTAIGAAVLVIGRWATALGSSASAAGSAALALGHKAKADGTYAVAIGVNAEAEANDSVAIGPAASVTAVRAWAIGSGASSSSADQGRLRANAVVIDRSSGSGRTTLYLRSDDGSLKQLVVDNNNRLIVGGVAVLQRGAPYTDLFPANAQVSSGGAVNLRVGPGNQHAAIGAWGSGNLYDTGIRRSTDEQWAYVFFHGVGWGYFPATRVIPR